MGCVTSAEVLKADAAAEVATATILAAADAPKGTASAVCPGALHPRHRAPQAGDFRVICGPGVSAQSDRGVPEPVAPDIVYSCVFTVPAYPAGPKEQWARQMYLWFNLFFSNSQTRGGAAIENQFSSQLVLGDIFAASDSGPPYYQPVYGSEATYQIQAQYYMAFDPEESINPKVLARGEAVKTGRLVPVQPGESIYTTFQLSADSSKWTLRIGVMGYGPERESVVVADKPFLGVLDVKGLDLQWKDYDTVLAECNWEIYGAKGPDSVPTGMSYDVAIAGCKPRRWTQWETLSQGDVPSTLSFEASNFYPCGQATAPGEYMTQHTRFNICTAP